MGQSMIFRLRIFFLIIRIFRMRVLRLFHANEIVRIGIAFK